MSAPAIPLALLRDLAARLPLPVDAAGFVELAADLADLAAAAPDAPPHRATPAADLAARLDLHWRATAAGGVGGTGGPGLPPAQIPAERKGVTWTPEEIARATDLLDRGKTAAEVAAALGRPFEATRTAIKRYGLRSTPGTPGPRGRFGMGAAPAGAAAARRDAWTDAQSDRLLRLKESGESIEAIAIAMDRTADACEMQLTKLRRRGACVPARDTAWTPAQDAELRTLKNQGKAWAEIAAALTRTERAVQQRHAKLKARDPVPAPAAPRPPAVTPADTPARTPALEPLMGARFVRASEPEEGENLQEGIIKELTGGEPMLVRAGDELAAGRAAGLPALQLEILRHMISLPDDFAPADDLALAEALLQREAPADIAEALGCAARDVMARWRAMICSAIADRRGYLSIDGQPALMAVLRWRAAREAADA